MFCMDPLGDYISDLMPISSLRRLFGRLVLFILFFLCTLVFALPTFAQSSVVIGEVQWAGSERSTADEWIELWNLGSTPFSLSGFRLRGVGGDHDLIFSARDEIAPQSAFLIANYHAQDPKSTLLIEGAIVTTTLSVTNEKTTIHLLDLAGNTVDEARWENTAPAGSSITPRSSMIRLFTEGTSSTTWFSATTSQNLMTDINQYGSPGFCDGCGPNMATLISDTIINSSTTSEPILEPEVVVVPPAETENETALAPLEEVEQIDPEFPIIEDDLGIDTSASSNDSNEPTEDIITTSTAEHDPAPAEVELATEDPAVYTTSTPLDLETALATSSVTLIPESPSSLLVPEALPTTTPALTEDIPPTNTITPIGLSPPPSSIQSLEANFPVPIYLPPIEARVRFNEIYPAPSKGNEWIELSLGPSLAPSDIIGWSIRDPKKSLLTIQKTTPFSWNASKQLLLFSLASGKMPNKGTSLLLVDIQGKTRDQVTVPSIIKDAAWARTSETGTDWAQTRTPTPAQINKLSIASNVSTTSTVIPQKTLKVAPKAPTVQTPTISSSLKTVKKDPASIKGAIDTVILSTSKEKQEIVQLASQKASSSTKKTVAKKAAPKKATTPTKKKTTTASASTLPQSVDLKTLGPMHASTRVRLTGTVATLPRLLGNNAFVIQTDDGRGLYVSGNTKQTSPPFRTHIELTGTLSLNDDGLILHMYASDRWRIVGLEHAVQPRVPDLDQPSLEDAWSYIQIRGIVSAITPTRITILHNQTEIAVSIRPVVRYRTERLKKGDEIEVGGILDTRKESLVLLPRFAEEIRLIQPAPANAITTKSTTATPLPWMPVGVAGMSIAATQGVRRYWKYRLERKIRFSEPR
jgi:hypothetical protein